MLGASSRLLLQTPNMYVGREGRLLGWLSRNELDHLPKHDEGGDCLGGVGEAGGKVDEEGCGLGREVAKGVGAVVGGGRGLGKKRV